MSCPFYMYATYYEYTFLPKFSVVGAVISWRGQFVEVNLWTFGGNRPIEDITFSHQQNLGPQRHGKQTFWHFVQSGDCSGSLFFKKNCCQFHALAANIEHQQNRELLFKKAARYLQTTTHTDRERKREVNSWSEHAKTVLNLEPWVLVTLDARTLAYMHVHRLEKVDLWGEPAKEGQAMLRYLVGLN